MVMVRSMGIRYIIIACLPRPWRYRCKPIPIPTPPLLLIIKVVDFLFFLVTITINEFGSSSLFPVRVCFLGERELVLGEKYVSNKYQPALLLAEVIFICSSLRRICMSLSAMSWSGENEAICWLRYSTS